MSLQAGTGIHRRQQGCATVPHALTQACHGTFQMYTEAERAGLCGQLAVSQTTRSSRLSRTGCFSSPRLQYFRASHVLTVSCHRAAERRPLIICAQRSVVAAATVGGGLGLGVFRSEGDS